MSEVGAGFKPTLTNKLYAKPSYCSSLTIVPTNSDTYDLMFGLGTSPQYTVYAKILDTVVGSAIGAVKGLHNIKVVDTQDAIPGASVPNLYTVEVLTENSANPQERAKLQALYQY